MPPRPPLPRRPGSCRCAPLESILPDVLALLRTENAGAWLYLHCPRTRTPSTTTSPPLPHPVLLVGTFIVLITLVDLYQGCDSLIGRSIPTFSPLFSVLFVLPYEHCSYLPCPQRIISIHYPFEKRTRLALHTPNPPLPVELWGDA